MRSDWTSFLQPLILICLLNTHTTPAFTPPAPFACKSRTQRYLTSLYNNLFPSRLQHTGLPASPQSTHARTAAHLQLPSWPHAKRPLKHPTPTTCGLQTLFSPPHKPLNPQPFLQTLPPSSLSALHTSQPLNPPQLVTSLTPLLPLQLTAVPTVSAQGRQTDVV